MTRFNYFVCLSVAACALGYTPLLAAQASNATAIRAVTIAVLSRADDDKLDARKIEAAQLLMPGGAPQDGIAIAIEEADFELSEKKLSIKLQLGSAATLEQAKQLIAQAEKNGAIAIVTDWPLALIQGVANQTKLAILSTRDTSDSLREAQCAANVFHLAPSQRMQNDSVAQWLVQRKWSKVLLLAGPEAADQAQTTAVTETLKRYGLKAIATRPFKLSADPRERDLANPLLLTGGIDYDVVWVVDNQGDFARQLPYRTALARPVVGSAGLVAETWHRSFDRYGAPQLSRRFLRTHKRPMSGSDWAAWAAAKVVLQALTKSPKVTGETLKALLTQTDFDIDGFKGTKLSFRPWDRQLRQPLLLTDGQAVLQTAPLEGFLHPTNNLDSIGADQAEKKCKAN
jgi:ABC transporter substrate binding protein (PQQ-dependent alcohol dehydrogenase system)